MYRNHLIQF